MSAFVYYLKSPFVLAAFACGILFYTGTVSVRETDEYSAPMSRDNVTWISGIICTNPVKSASGKSYSAKIRLTSVGTLIDGLEVKSMAKGTVDVRIPSNIVEAIYPGKLYSLAERSVLVENGECISGYARWQDNLGTFSMSNIQYEGHEGGVIGFLMHFRAVCRLIFKRMMFSWGYAGGLVLSLLSGAKEYLEDGLGESFRTAGLSHILALSGMHLSFFGNLSGQAGRVAGKSSVIPFQLFGVLFFVWFAGLSPSLFRAMLCALISLAGKLFHCKRFDTLEVLCCSFLIHSAVFPKDMFSVAFMLSYGALAGILIFSDLFKRLLVPIFPENISSSLSASTGAQIITAPISLGIFGSFAPVGIVATVIVSPVVSIFMTVSLVFIVTGFLFPFLSPVFGSIMDTIYGGLAFIVRIFAKVPPIKIF